MLSVRAVCKRCRFIQGLITGADFQSKENVPFEALRSCCNQDQADVSIAVRKDLEKWEEQTEGKHLTTWRARRRNIGWLEVLEGCNITDRSTSYSTGFGTTMLWKSIELICFKSR